MADPTPGAILVGVDNSPNSSKAAAWALSIAGATGLPITAVAAWTSLDPSVLHGIDDHISEMSAATAQAATRSLSAAGVVGLDVIGARGEPAAALLEIAKRSEAAMLVVGTRGLGPLSGLLLGSISRRLLFTSDFPLVLVPRQSTLNPTPPRRILVGVDCSQVARRVLSFSVKLCAALRVPATIVRCADPGCEKPPGHVEHFDDQIVADTEKAVAQFRKEGVGYKVMVCNGDPRVGLPETAAVDDAGLIIIGTRGAGHFSGLGGTASYLVRHSSLPLVAVP